MVRGSIFEEETWDADTAVSFCLIESRIIIAKRQELLQIPDVFANVYQFIIGIAGQPGLNLRAIRAGAHYKNFCHFT